MSNREDVALLAHLMRRAGFGATRDDLEAMAEQGYEATVEQLIDYESQPAVDEYTLYRYHPITEVPGGAAAPRSGELVVFQWSTHRGRLTRRWRFSGTMYSPQGTQRLTTATTYYSRFRCSAMSA